MIDHPVDERATPRGTARQKILSALGGARSGLTVLDGWPSFPVVGFLRSGGKRTATGRAQVVNAENQQLSWKAKGIDGQVSGFSATEATNLKSSLTVAVFPDDGGPGFGAILSFRGHTDESVRAREGGWTYVRYDPAKPEDGEIDRDRLVNEFGREHKVMFPTWAAVQSNAAQRAIAEGKVKPGESWAYDEHGEPVRRLS